MPPVKLQGDKHEKAATLNAVEEIADTQLWEQSEVEALQMLQKMQAEIYREKRTVQKASSSQGSKEKAMETG